jgi:hypothetical protein
MSKVKIELNSDGIRELLKSSEVMSECKKYADNAVSSLGDGYEVTTYTGKTRVNASVMATTYETRKENMENNLILKAVHG